MDVSELERRLKSAEARAAELQVWADDAQAENERLMQRIVQLETKPDEAQRLSQLEAQLKEARGESETLRARVASLESRPSSEAGAAAKIAELQSWADAADAENEKLRAQVAQLAAHADDAQTIAQLRAEVAQLKSRNSAPAGRDPRDVAKLAELQGWADAADAENEKLRAQVAQLEARAPVSHDAAKVAELQSWADAADAENEQLRAQLEQLKAASSDSQTIAQLRAELAQLKANAGHNAHDVAKLAELQGWADAADAENEKLRAENSALKSNAGGASKIAELQSWADAADTENEKLRAENAALKSNAGGAAKIAELQSWADAADAENEKLRAEVEQLKAQSGEAKLIAELRAELAALKAQASAPAGHDSHDVAKIAELQSWADAADAENEQLRAEIAALKAKSGAPAGHDSHDVAKIAELQSWANAADAENEQLRAQLEQLKAGAGDAKTIAELRAEISELKARVGTPAGHDSHDVAKIAELQSWADAADAENEQLRAQLEQLKARGGHDAHDVAKIAELQSWADAADAENEQLRAQLAAGGAPGGDPAGLRQRVGALEKQLQIARQVSEGRVAELDAWVKQSESENEGLRERVAGLEKVNQRLQHMASGFAERLKTSADDDVRDLEAKLNAARSEQPEKVGELESLLANAREAIATLENERAAAVEQVRRYVTADNSGAEKDKLATEASHQIEIEDRDRLIANLQAQLAEKVDEASVLQVRIKAYVSEEERLQEELKHQRERACVAEEKVGHAQAEVDTLREDNAALQAKLLDTQHKLEESQRWNASNELELAQAQKELEAARTELAVTRSGASAEAAAAAARNPNQPPPPPPEALEEGDDLEGFSVQRMHRLEALLAAEKMKSEGLGALLSTVEKSAAQMQDQLEAARGKLADLQKKLGLDDAEMSELFDRLDAARRELHSLRKELGKPLPEGPTDALTEELADAQEVLDAPLKELDAVAEQQAKAAKEATDALAQDQRARDQLVSDLTWLKGELEKLTHVRADLRQRIQAMVQRELARKATVGALLAKLRSTEVAAAARAGSLRRLHAAMELAQKNAVRVQTMYFQKQIGSLQRQLETALKPKKPLLRRVP